MLLSSDPTLGRWMQTAFTGFVIFWLVVLVALYFGVGVLLKRHDRARSDGDENSAAH